MPTNPIPTQPETLEPCPFCGVFPVMQSHTQEDEMDEGRYVFFVECGNRQCPMGLVSTGGPFRESAKAAECWNTRAAVTAPRGDVATTARNRDVAQRVVMSTEGVLGERFDIAARHELADRITAALDAATSSPHSAERESPILAFEKWLTRYVTDCGKLSQTEYSIAYAAFIAAHPGEGPLARTMNDLAPPERTRVAGEQE